VYYSLSVAERRLGELTQPTGFRGYDPTAERADDARRALGRARTELEFRRVEELLTDLPSVLAEVQAASAEASSAIAARFFHHTQPVRWIA
jgi:uncharacterized alpha-E superfamily protein